MKIRHPALIKTAAFSGAQLIRLWLRTVRFAHQSLGPNLDPRQPGLSGRYIYAIWHEALLLPTYQFARPDMCVLISQHADGQLITDIARRLGFSVVQGSTTRGSVEAVRRLLEKGQTSHLVITTDGPRGPRRQVQQGLVYLSSRTGLPIVPAGFGFSRAWRTNSWDRFALPKPWSRGFCVSGQPISVPADADKAQLEAYRKRVEDDLLAVTDLAEQWAETGTWSKEIARKVAA